MALLSKENSSQKKKIKIEINNEILQKIHSYCEWSNIDDINFFFEEAACYIFAKDKEWKAYQKQVKRSEKANAPQG